MEPDKASLTALGVAYFRAYHSERGDDPVFDDTLAGSLLTNEERTTFNEMGLAALKANHPDLVSEDPEKNLENAFATYPATAGVLVRSRFTEDRLNEALPLGIKQYVVIGAGMDTFALRRPDLSSRLNIFEIDHPTTQAFKMERTAEAGLRLPANLYFAPADFERDTVASALANTPFNPELPSFFVWHGVTYYLTREAIAATLDSVRSVAAPGSELVFDYADQRYLDDPTNQTDDIRDMLALVASFGEPWLSGFDPESLAPRLSSHGFGLVADLNADEMRSRYLEGRQDILNVPEIWHLAHVNVA